MPLTLFEAAAIIHAECSKRCPIEAYTETPDKKMPLSLAGTAIGSFWGPVGAAAGFAAGHALEKKKEENRPRNQDYNYNVACYEQCVEKLLSQLEEYHSEPLEAQIPAMKRARR